MNKKGYLWAIFIGVWVYIVFDLVIWKGFLYQLMQGFLGSMKEQGKIGLVVAFIGLALIFFGVGTCILLLTGRGISPKVPPAQRATLKTVRLILGVILGTIGVYLSYYGFTLNQ